MLSRTITKTWTSFIAGCGFFSAFFLFSPSLLAKEAPESTNFLPTESLYANWIFAGMVTSENGEYYGYYFQMQREKNQFHATTALFKEENKEVVLQEDAYARIDDPTDFNWRVGRAFLKFNPINDSWIFGIKTKEKKGFNFKVDLLNQQDNLSGNQQKLSSEINLVINQTNRLNGHLQLSADEKEQFVTSKNAWFRQITFTSEQNAQTPLSGVLCRFVDNSGFYSVNVKKENAKPIAIRGFCDASGGNNPNSPVLVKELKNREWHIQTKSPAQDLTLQKPLKQDAVIAGFVSRGKLNGFCMLNDKQQG